MRHLFMLVLIGSWPWAALAGAADVIIGERPAIEPHVDQTDIEQGRWRPIDLINHGRQLFEARFNHLDGQGRPGSTGTGAPRTPDQPPFVRTSSPDANACAGCHNQPATGGAGDFVANVFVLAQAADPVTLSIAPEFSNERNTLGMFGSGAIEMLAREMSEDLIAIREAAAVEAASSSRTVMRQLTTKGVSFGHIVVLPDGRVDPTGIEGVDWDLIIKPFHQKGAVVSLREFTNNAMNHHHGMQSSERFGQGVDADLDGVVDELTDGDVTALTVFQASLPAPGPVLETSQQRRRAIAAGARSFAEIGCQQCHRATLVLASAVFSEPNPFNPPGNLRLDGFREPLLFDLRELWRNRNIERNADGTVSIHPFTDLKRHDLNDDDYQHFANEQLAQGSLAGFADPAGFTVADEPRPLREFLTSKLWDVGSTMPYGHRGDLTTLTEAIHFHGGAAREVRDRFFDLPAPRQAEIIEFLRNLRADPEVAHMRPRQ